VIAVVQDGRAGQKSKPVGAETYRPQVLQKGSLGKAKEEVPIRIP